MKKCDIIIPIYNSPEWVNLCVYALFQNTPDEYINKVILMNDNSSKFTLNCLKNIEQKYKDKVILKTNQNNLGFVKNVNAGLELSNAETVLLLNSDCLLAKNTIPKLIAHIEKDSSIGLICPVASNAANITLEMFEGYNYMQMDALLEQNFSGECFDACTVVGNCLMITRECLDKVGKLDEIYGMGYGEETDYQFKSEEKGFSAKLAIDTYVFHKSEASFGTSEEKQKKLEKNRKIFFDRWREPYEKKMKEYVKNDPIEYIKNKLKSVRNEIVEPEVLFFLPDIHQRAGGVHVVVDLVNYMCINGVNASILTERIHSYDEIMIFNPCFMKNIDKIKPKCIVGTIYPTIFFVKTIAEKYDIPYVNFMQGYEPCFDNGEVYSWAELACKNSTNILAISEFLKNKCIMNFGKEATVIPNNINLRLLYNNSREDTRSEDKKVITLVFRDSYNKADFMLAEILKNLTLKELNIEINVIYTREIMFPINNSDIKVNMYEGPLSREKVNQIMNTTDIYIDTAIIEGFGLTPLEAMASGVVPIMSNSFGVNEYAKDGENSFVIKEINNVDKYIEKVEYLLNNVDVLNKMRKNALETSKNFDIQDNIGRYIDYFRNAKKEKVELSDIDLENSKRWYVKDEMIFKELKESNKKVDNNKSGNKVSFKRKVFLFFLKLFPKSFKTKVKNKLRQIVND